MSRFISNELHTIDLGEGDFVKILKESSFEIMEKMNESNKNELEIAKIMLINFVKEWNLKDNEGNEIPVTEENILKLNIPTINVIAEEITKILSEKKILEKE